MGKRLNDLRAKVEQACQGEPQFDWENTDGEARQRHADAHIAWSERVLHRVRQLIKEA